MDGTGSTPSSGTTIVSYSWIQIAGSHVSLNGAHTATPTFTTPTVGTFLAFSLTVTYSTDTVSIPAPVTSTVN